MSDGSPFSFTSNNAIKASKSAALVILVSIPAQAVLIAALSVVTELGTAEPPSAALTTYQSVSLSKALASVFFCAMY